LLGFAGIGGLDSDKYTLQDTDQTGPINMNDTLDLKWTPNKHLIKDIRKSFAHSDENDVSGDDGVDKHFLTHGYQAKGDGGVYETAQPNGNCWYRGEGAYGDKAREGFGLCRRMTRDGPVKVSCCDSNIGPTPSKMNYDGLKRVGSSDRNATDMATIGQYAGTNCQVSPHYRTSPSLYYHKQRSLYGNNGGGTDMTSYSAQNTPASVFTQTAEKASWEV